MKRLLAGILICVGLIYAGPPLFSQDSPMTLEAFKTAIAKNKQRESWERLEPWKSFRNFDLVLQAMSKSELRDYERAQRVHIDKEAPNTENIRRVEEIELIAFQRAFPQLAPAFDDPEVQDQFRRKYSMIFSYGWRRWHIWRSYLLSKNIAKNAGVSLKPVSIELGRYNLLQGQYEGPPAQGSLGLFYKRLFNLAICVGYRPAVADIVRATRVQQTLKLSAPLSYLLMSRAKEKKIRLISKDKWLAEIDRVLTESEKQKFASLVTNNDKLKAELAFCGGR